MFAFGQPVTAPTVMTSEVCVDELRSRFNGGVWTGWPAAGDSAEQVVG